MFQKLKNLNYYIFKILLYGFVIMLIGNNNAFAEFKCPKTGGIFKTVDLAYPSMDQEPKDWEYCFLSKAVQLIS